MALTGDAKEELSHLEVTRPSARKAATASRSVSMSRTVCTPFPPPISAWATPLRGPDGRIKAQ